MTLRSMAKKIGVSVSTLSRISRGKAYDYETALRIIRSRDSDLAEEVEALMNYFRVSLARTSKKLKEPHE